METRIWHRPFDPRAFFCAHALVTEANFISAANIQGGPYITYNVSIDERQNTGRSHEADCGFNIAASYLP
jgi:hypothetical protein